MYEEGMIMGKVSMGIISLASIGAVLTVLFTAPTAASLVPMSFGFPVMVQSGQSFAFSSDQASFADIESIDIGFPMFDGIMSGSGMPEMPSAGTNSWPMQGMTAPDFGLMGGLFDLSRFKFP